MKKNTFQSIIMFIVSQKEASYAQICAHFQGVNESTIVRNLNKGIAE
jgi:hypothetical protein